MRAIEWSELTCPGPTWPWVSLHAADGRSGTRVGGRPAVLLPKAILEKRVELINRSYTVISWSDDFAKAQVECKNIAAHTTDTGDGQTVIFTGADSRGVACYHCSHAHCDQKEGFNDTETQALREAFIELETVILYPDHRIEPETRALFELMLKSGNFYKRNETYPFGMLRWQSGMAEPIPLSVSTFTLQCAKEDIRFSKHLKKGLKSANPLERETRMFLEAEEAGTLPIAKSYARRPVLIKDPQAPGGARIIAQEYARELGVIVLGKKEDIPQLEIDFKEARSLLEEFMSHWKWKEKGDQSRAWAELLTPALLQGGFIEWPTPIFLVTADESAAGKTFWHKVVSWIYQEKALPHALDNGPVGGTNDLLKNSIARGDNFFFVDELDGMVKNPTLNALITGDDVTDIRNVFEKAARVSVDHLMVMMAGKKGFTIEVQTASRVMPIRIIKTDYLPGPDGRLLEEWVKDNTLKLLGSIYAVIAEWMKAGGEYVQPDGRFPSWSRVINSILEKILGLPHATSGLEKIQDDISNANMGWMEKVLEALEEEGLVWGGNGNSAIRFGLTGLKNFVLDAGLEIPGVRTQNPESRTRMELSQIARAIKSLRKLREEKGLIIRVAGNYFVHCFETSSDHREKTYRYVFSNKESIPGNIKEYVVVDNLDLA
jgi:hypothetical protein